MRGPMNLRLFLLAGLGLAIASGQTQDTSGNGLLKGSFRFRHVAVQNTDDNGNPTEMTASFGTITFDGGGNYTLSGTTIDNTVSGGAAQPLTATGAYAIGANGTGYVASPLYTDDSFDYEYGAVSQGIFIGSSTEAEAEGFILNDIFVAIPIAAAAPTNASFTSAYQTGVLDFTSAASGSAIKNALFKLSPDGKGGFGTITLNGQAANQTASTLTQTVAGGTYAFNADVSATLTLPLPSGVTSTNALFTGSKTMYQSADGNFILGWTTAGYDIFVGVKALSVSGTNALSSGLYFTAGLEDSPQISGADSFYGGISNFGDSAGDSIEHARLNFPGFSAYDFGTDNQISVNADGSAGPDFSGYLYAFGLGGQAFVAIGSGGNFSLQVGLHAAAFTGTGVFINPVGVVNAASYQPITASLAPGELITIFGSGLAKSTQTTAGGQPFPTNLGGVTVTIDNIPCPIYYVSGTQIAVIVPYELASNTTALANIQVTNSGVQSNVVQMYFQASAPGAFSQSTNGIGLAAALHAATGQLITKANPAQAGEYISLYLTGLGTVTPTVANGALGPTNPLSLADENANGNLAVFFDDYGPSASATVGNQGNIQFAGLAPSLAGLYQINVQVPTTGLGSGDNVYIELSTDTADVNQIQIPYGSASSGSTAARPARPMAQRARLSAIRRSAHKTQTRVVRGGVNATGRRPNQ
jgi:uncharacterized protein (TIGR03437 family)